VQGLDIKRDIAEPEFADLRQTRAGDNCDRCGGEIELSRGIEVGQVFALGRCYTEPMDVQFQSQDGKRAVAMMGCYGIGVSRLVAAVVEQCHDDSGIKWPVSLAPFQVALISMSKSDAVLGASEKLYLNLQNAGIEVLWDERKERPGVKFKDAELIGLPLQIVIGDRGLDQGMAEVGLRQGERHEVPMMDVLEQVKQLLGSQA
jgi:prolyl-tRNA synthetase